jgi:hypothetical protein
MMSYLLMVMTESQGRRCTWWWNSRALHVLSPAPDMHTRAAYFDVPACYLFALIPNKQS